MIYGYLITGKPFIPDNYNNNTDLDLTVRYIQWYPENSGINVLIVFPTFSSTNCNL